MDINFFPHSEAIGCALFRVSATTAVEVDDSLICGKYHTFWITSVFSTDKILFHPTHIGIADGAMHKSIIHNRSRYLAFLRLSGSFRLRISLEELIERAAIFGLFEYASISNFNASYAQRHCFLKAILLDILLSPPFAWVSEMCVKS